MMKSRRHSHPGRRAFAPGPSLPAAPTTGEPNSPLTRKRTLLAVIGALTFVAVVPGSFGTGGFGTPGSRSHHFLQTPVQPSHWTAAPAARLRATRLTDGISALAAELQAGHANKASLSRRLVSLSRSRQRALVRLLAKDPQAVRSMILARRARRALGRLHGARVETEVALEGRYRIWHRDDFKDPSRDVFLDQLVTRDNKVFTLNGATSRVAVKLTFARLKPNARMSVRGYALGDQVLATQVGTPRGRSLEAASAAATTGPITAAVIAVNFSDSATPMTATDMNAIKAVFQGNPGADAVSYFSETSYGKASLVPSFYGPYTIASTTSAECNSSSRDDDAMRAANADVDFTKFRRLIFVLNCPGLGGVALSEGALSTPDGTITAAETELDPASAKRLDIEVHELAHTLGSFSKHASFYVCRPDAFVPPTRFGDGCTSAEYGDGFDVLGSANSSQLDPLHKNAAGWLDAGQFPTVTTSGTYTLAPYEQASPNGQPLALNIPRGHSGNTFTVEYRQPIGFDSWMGTASCPGCTVTRGASIRLSNFITSGSGGGSDTQLIDTTPGTISSYSYYQTEDGRDGALLPGKTFTDPEYDISITAVSATASGLTVQVSLPPQTCTHAAPGVTSVTPTSQTAAAGQTKTYTFTVMNNDSSGCPAGTFRYISLPGTDDITTVASPDYFTLAPGASTTVSLSVTSSPSAVDGTYLASGPGKIFGNSLDASPTPVGLTYVVTSPADTTAPAAPTGLTAQAAGSGVVKVSWTAATDNLGVVGYRIIANTGSVYTTQTTSYLDTNLPPGTTRTYSVQAFDRKSNFSAVATVAVTTPSKTDFSAPSAPNLSATATDHSVSLSWSPSTDNVGVAYYEVRPCLVRDCKLPASASSFTTGGLPTRTRYDVQIFAYDRDGNWSSVGGGKLTVYTAAAGTTAPSQPRQFISTAGVAGRIDLSWAPSTDDRGIARYDVYRNNRKLGSTTSTSFTDTTVIMSGEYYVQAVDTDGSLSPPSSRAWFIVPSSAGTDTTAPAANITAPASGATVSGTFTINASASDNAGVSKVEFYVDGVLQGTDTSAPYTSSWDTSAAGSGTHWLFARAYDGAGNYGTSSVTLVTVGSGGGGGDTTPPTVAITAPTNGSTVSGVTTISTAASDNVAVTRVELLVDGTVKGTDTAAPYNFTWDSTSVANGSHAIAAQAFDIAGNNATAAVTVTASNAAPDTTPPSAPSDLAAVAAGSTAMNLTWTASTDNVGVTGYDVYRNGAKIATATSTSYADTGLTAATAYTYTVVAQDAAGNASAPSNTAQAATAALDTQAPGKPGSPRASVTGTTQIALKWSASTDNVGVVAYDLYRDGAMIDETSVPNYLDSGLAPGSSHSYYVVARDTAGNRSVASSTLSTHTGSLSTSSTGTIAGVVYNPEGKPLANAIIQVTVNGAVKNTKTSSSGVFKLSSLPAGDYTLTISLAGYQTAGAGATAVAGQSVLLVSVLSL
jgi:chitodextrinase